MCVCVGECCVGSSIVCVVCVVCIVCSRFWSSRFSLPRTAPSARTAQNFALFFSLPPEISFFLLSLGVFSLNFGGVFEGRHPQMCTFGLSDCGVKPQAASGPPGLHTTTRELQTRTFERPGASNTTKIPPPVWLSLGDVLITLSSAAP